jgi:hypothetical protein
VIGPFRALSLHGRSGVWLGAVGEVLIVALGVLLAFGLNAWWVESTTRAEEQTHLRALARDFERNVGVYSELIRRQQRIVDKSLELLRLARKQPDAEPAVVVDLLGPVFTSLREEPALDAYNALVNSAGLALISDEELRSDLAGFATRATDPYYVRYSDQLYMNFTTRFVGRLHMLDLVADDSTPPRSFAELLSDPAFQEHLAFRHAVESQVQAVYEELLSESEDILDELRAQLGTAAP